jgi:hypothetical protein
MPNWCYTSYVIEGDKKELEDLHNRIRSLQNLPEPEQAYSFGKLWLKNVLELFGDIPEGMYYRGNIVDYPELSDVLRFQTMTAWADMNGVWDSVLSHYESLHYYYSSEEPGCILYYTNDEDGTYFERYLVDDWGEGQEYYNTEEEVIAYVSERLGIALTSWESMEKELEKYNDKNEDRCINVHKFEIE